jgi:TatD DNase family protein
MIDDLPATLARAAAAGVERFVHIGCTPAAWPGALALADADDRIHAAIGIHPHDAILADDTTLAELARLLRTPASSPSARPASTTSTTARPARPSAAASPVSSSSRAQLGKPIVLHIRDAHADAWAEVDALPAVPGIVHCFTGTPDEAHGWLARGYHLSFSGIVTFPNAGPLREAARICPADRILLETDAPYLAPVPVRGRKNEPANVAYTCAQLAALRGEAPEALARAASANARALLRLPQAGPRRLTARPPPF